MLGYSSRRPLPDKMLVMVWWPAFAPHNKFYSTKRKPLQWCHLETFPSPYDRCLPPWHGQPVACQRAMYPVVVATFMKLVTNLQETDHGQQRTSVVRSIDDRVAGQSSNSLRLRQ